MQTTIISSVGQVAQSIVSQLRETRIDENYDGFCGVLEGAGITGTIGDQCKAELFWEHMQPENTAVIEGDEKNATLAEKLGIALETEEAPKALLLYELMNQLVPELRVSYNHDERGTLQVMLQYANGVGWDIPLVNFFTSDAPEQITAPPKARRKRTGRSRRTASSWKVWKSIY